MPLTAAFPTLVQDIEAAFADKNEAMQALKENDDAARSAIEMKFYFALGMAIHTYTMSATVMTTVVTGVVGVAGPLAPVGACPVAGAGTGSGTGNLL
tara:strand:+ start:601 stop:891 length:291 start_codon:yes stop_codon:yes gene_type:complete